MSGIEIFLSLFLSKHPVLKIYLLEAIDIFLLHGSTVGAGAV